MAESSLNPQLTWCFRKSKSYSSSEDESFFVCSKKQRLEDSKKKWRLENPEKVKEHSKRWREKNPEKVKELTKKWRLENPEKVKENKKRWCEENPEKVKEYQKRFQAKKSFVLNLKKELKNIREKKLEIEKNIEELTISLEKIKIREKYCEGLLED